MRLLKAPIKLNVLQVIIFKLVETATFIARSCFYTNFYPAAPSKWFLNNLRVKNELDFVSKQRFNSSVTKTRDETELHHLRCGSVSSRLKVLQNEQLETVQS